MNILLTGATGFIGQNFCNYLKNKKHSVLAISRKKTIKNKKNFKFINSSFIISKKNLAIINDFKPDVVVNFAWYGIPNFSYKNSKKNLLDQKFFFEKIKNIQSIKKIISFGSCWEYRKKSGICLENDSVRKDTFFNKSKFKIKFYLEDLCKEKSIDFFWLRLFYVYGPYQKKKSLLPSLIFAIKNKKKNPVNSINNTNDFVYVGDVCKLIYKLLMSKTAKKGTYNIGSGKLTSVKKIIEIVYNYYNLKLEKKKVKYNKSIYASIKKIKKIDKFFSPLNLKRSIIKTIKYYA